MKLLNAVVVSFAFAQGALTFAHDVNNEFSEATIEVDSDFVAPADGNVIEFEIKKGTGHGSWNTKENAVVIKVGDTLRIKNLDTVIHRLHTNGTPCPHGPTMPALTGTYDCVAAATFDPNVDGSLYDHNDGSAAKFWVKVEK